MLSAQDRCFIATFPSQNPIQPLSLTPRLKTVQKNSLKQILPTFVDFSAGSGLGAYLVLPAANECRTKPLTRLLLHATDSVSLHAEPR